MLFNSFGFLFLFLPVVLLGYRILSRHRAWSACGTAWLALASLAFYGWWDWRFLSLLMASIIFNFWCARQPRLLALGIAANLGALAYFKYANFFVTSLGGQPWDIVLPVGISFFTFTQIAYLVDCRRGQAGEYRFVHYVLFVSYFPHLIAGPILHHREMMPQFDRKPRLSAPDLAIGLSVFVVGLSKKVLLADPVSALAAPVFAHGGHPALLEAWIGVLAYTFQLYFDFSGYSDMAIGLSRMFGVRLPLNFNSPYKAADISDFWRRWHMSLSRFLRDYLYIPLGGNRGGAWRHHRNLMLTMLLGGLWHGAGWTFVVWGGLHGLYLVVHHTWRSLSFAHLPPLLGRSLTMLAVMLAWVPFRAPDLASAGDILLGLAGGNGVSLPHSLAPAMPAFAVLGWHPSFNGLHWIEVGGPGLPILMLAMLLAFLAPNTQELFRHYDLHLRTADTARWAWRPDSRHGAALAVLFLVCLFNMNKVSEFLYFQF